MQTGLRLAGSLLKPTTFHLPPQPLACEHGRRTRYLSPSTRCNTRGAPLTGARRVRAHDENANSADCEGQPKLVELPEELQGLSINDGGLLVDEKTGKVINSLGATRFDVAVTAMRGLLDPPTWVENTEHTPGLILGSLVRFPTKYCFSIVGSRTPGFQEDMLHIIERVCQATVDPGEVRAVERLGGKYLSLQIDVMVRAPEVVSMVIEELGKDSRVKMRY